MCNSEKCRRTWQTATVQQTTYQIWGPATRLVVCLQYLYYGHIEILRYRVIMSDIDRDIICTYGIPTCHSDMLQSCNGCHPQ